MTLQTSGPISLGNVQTEFGGANPISMSEYYAGGTYVPSGTSGTNGPVPSSGTIGMDKFYGTSAILDTQTVTVAVYFNGSSLQYGYQTSLFGSISDGTFNPKSGSAIRKMYWNVSVLYFEITGVHTNAGWTNLAIAGQNLARSSATFSDTTNTIWSWGGVTTNPFPDSGAEVPCVFS